MEKGRIFDIQRYSIHDGRGIRTIVFLKGCFLRCPWCCNPESQSHEIETMRVDGEDKTIGRDVTACEVLDIVERDRPYYRRSGGGMTLSGGECLYQHAFTAALLAGARDRGLHTAVESTALAPFETIAPMLPNIDQFLMDIKHTDTEKHKEFTGAGNARGLENAAKIAVSGQTELIIRVPVVPDFNATEDECLGIARFAAGLPGVKRIHLLPYHSYGAGKYEGLNREYPMGDAKSPTDAEMEALRRAITRETPLECIIGG